MALLGAGMLMVAAVAGMGARPIGNSGTVDWLNDRSWPTGACSILGGAGAPAGAPGAFGPVGVRRGAQACWVVLLR